MSTSNLKNPLVVRQGNTQDWENSLWPVIDNSVVSPVNRLSKELLKLKIFPIRMKKTNAIMTVIFYKWFQRIFKSKRYRFYHKNLRKKLKRQIFKKQKRSYLKRSYLNRAIVNANYQVVKKKKRYKRVFSHLYRQVKKRKNLLHRKKLKRLRKHFKYPERYRGRLKNLKSRRKASPLSSKNVVDAIFKVDKVVQVKQKKGSIKKKISGNSKKFRKSKKKLFYIKSVSNLFVAGYKSLALWSMPVWILKKLYSQSLVYAALELRKKRRLKGKAYVRYSRRKDLFSRIFKKWKQKLKIRPLRKNKGKRNVMPRLNYQKKKHGNSNRFSVSSKKEGPNKVSYFLQKQQGDNSKFFKAKNKQKRSAALVRRLELTKKKFKMRKKKALLFKKNISLVGEPWRKNLKSVSKFDIFKRSFQSFRKKGVKKNLKKTRLGSLVNGNNKNFVYPKRKKPWWWWKHQGIKKPKRYAFRNRNKKRWTPHWMRKHSVIKRDATKKCRPITKKIFLYSRRFYRVWYRRIIYLKTRYKLWKNRFIKFRNRCRYVTYYCIPSLVAWNLSLTFSQLNCGIRHVHLINVFNGNSHMQKFSYLALLKNGEINNFLRSIKFLKYAVDAVLLNLLVLTKQSNSNIISYLVAEMLARNAAKKKQRSLINNLRKLMKVVTAYARRYCLKLLVDPTVLRIKITGKLAGSLRTRNYFVGPRHLPLHSIAHPI